MRIAVAAVMLLGLIVQQGSSLAAQSGTFRAYGATGKSCGVWTMALDDQRVVYEWWVLGFISGADYSRSGPMMGETDAPGVNAWITQYCADHPLDTMAKAAIELVRELRARGAKSN